MKSERALGLLANVSWKGDDRSWMKRKFRLIPPDHGGCLMVELMFLVEP